jgi:hypothetical protein
MMEELVVGLLSGVAFIADNSAIRKIASGPSLSRSGAVCQAPVPGTQLPRRSRASCQDPPAPITAAPPLPLAPALIPFLHNTRTGFASGSSVGILSTFLSSEATLEPRRRHAPPRPRPEGQSHQSAIGGTIALRAWRAQRASGHGTWFDAYNRFSPTCQGPSSPTSNTRSLSCILALPCGVVPLTLTFPNVTLQRAPRPAKKPDVTPRPG